MKRRRIRSKARPPEHPGQGAIEHPEGRTPGPESSVIPSHGQAEHEPDVERQAAPERDEEALASEAARSGDQEAVHEAGADEWLDAEVGSETPLEPRGDLQRE